MAIFNKLPEGNWLVVWNMNFMTFHSVGNVIIPTDELIFFRGIETTNQINIFMYRDKMR
jgi:hypothetical protein